MENFWLWFALFATSIWLVMLTSRIGRVKIGTMSAYDLNDLTSKRRDRELLDRIRFLEEQLELLQGRVGYEECKRQLGVVSQDVVQQVVEPFGWRLLGESIVRAVGVVPVQISGEVAISAV